MANRRPQQNSGRRMDFGRDNRNTNFGRSGVSPWQNSGPGSSGLPSLLPLGGDASQATLALASNIINLLQPRQNPVPSLLDMPIRRDFIPPMGRFDRGFGGPNRMGNQNFRRTGNYNRSGERINTNRKPFKPNDGQKQQNKTTPKKEADPKSKSKESEEKDKTEVKKEPGDKKEAQKTRYDDIKAEFLKCHICNKSMWDGRSFENHLGGRAHNIMMQKTAESYALAADTMRQEFKIREMKRTRKSGAQPARDFYCAMCDMYAADGAGHRTTVGHRKLKKYLHPACITCHKEMPTRIELDEHRLSAEHLRNMQDKQDVVVKQRPEVMVISTLAMEQSYMRDERGRHLNKRAKDEDSAEVKKEPEDGEGGEEKQTEEEGEKKEEIDNENTVVDYAEGDDLTGVTQEQYPKYSMERGVGRSFLEEFRCYQCKLCKKLLDSEETAEVHLKTWRHHQLFVRLLNEKTGRNQNEQKPQTSENNKRPLNNEENGNWKRRKTEGDSEANGHDEDMKEESHEEGEQSNDNENQGDASPNPDDLEDWEHSVDEMLQEEQEQNEQEQDGEQQHDDQQEEEQQAQEDQQVEEQNQEEEEQNQGEEEQNQGEEEENQEEEEQQEEEQQREPTPPPVKTRAAANTPRGGNTPTPRGRGRGRRRN